VDLRERRTVHSDSVWTRRAAKRDARPGPIANSEARFATALNQRNQNKKRAEAASYRAPAQFETPLKGEESGVRTAIRGGMVGGTTEIVRLFRVSRAGGGMPLDTGIKHLGTFVS